MASEVTGPSRLGRKITIFGDTNDASEAVELAANCDLLVHEATMENSLEEKAVAYGHSTPRMAATFAHKVRAKKLCLTHLSPR